MHRPYPEKPRAALHAGRWESQAQINVCSLIITVSQPPETNLQPPTDGTRLLTQRVSGVCLTHAETARGGGVLQPGLLRPLSHVARPLGARGVHAATQGLARAQMGGRQARGRGVGAKGGRCAREQAERGHVQKGAGGAGRAGGVGTGVPPHRCAYFCFVVVVFLLCFCTGCDRRVLYSVVPALSLDTAGEW